MLDRLASRAPTIRKGKEMQELVNPDPSVKYPFVVLRRLFKKVDKERNQHEEVEDVKIRIDGAHGSLPAFQEFKKQKMKIVGYGNLHPERHADLIHALRLETGEAFDARFNDAPASAQVIAARADALNEGGVVEDESSAPRRGRPRIKPVDAE